MLSSEWWIVFKGHVVWCYVITRLCSTSFATCLTLGSRHLYQRKENRMSSCLLVCRVSLLITLHTSQASAMLSSCRFSFVLWNLESGEIAMAWQSLSWMTIWSCKFVLQVLEKLLPVQNTHTTTKRRGGSLLWFVRIHFELVPSISSSRMLLKPRFLSMAGVL